MEATARQFSQHGDTVVVLRNGFFSYRWSQIFDARNKATTTPLDVAVMPAQATAAPAASDKICCMGVQNCSHLSNLRLNDSTPRSRSGDEKNARQFVAAPISEVVARIRELKPRVLFAPHVETSA